MRYRLKLLITSSAFLCVLLAQAAPAAESCVKTLYIDGVQVGQKTADQGLTWPYERITIGSESNRWYLYNEYVGKMDEFAIYKDVMDPNRIKAHYDANSNYTNYKNAVQADSPLLWLKFDDASTADGATADNSGSIGIDGTYIQTGGGLITKVAGINADSNAIDFPDRAADAPGHCVDVWDGNGDFSSDLDGDVTIELWVNFTDSNDYPRFFQHNGQWNMTGGYGLMVDNPLDPEPNIGIMGGGTTNYVDLATDINDGNWHHIVVTYDSTYEVPVTNTYVNEVMADDPCLYLRFEQFPLVDSSGHNYWARASSPVRVEKTMGSMGNAAYLNGGWVAAGPNQTEPCLPVQYGLQYAIAPNDVTFEFWLRTPEPGAVDGFAGLFVDSNGLDAPGISRADTKCRMQFGRNIADNQFCYSGEGAWPTDTNWHHFVVEYNELPDANGAPDQINVKLYRDMVSYKDSTYGPGTPCSGIVGPYMDHILIGHNTGSRDAPSNAPYRQYIDEFAVYHGCLSFDRIQAHYYAWAPKSCAEWRDRVMPMAVADKNQDCRIDFDDFARFALSWRKCNDPCDAGCSPYPW